MSIKFSVLVLCAALPILGTATFGGPDEESANTGNRFLDHAVAILRENPTKRFGGMRVEAIHGRFSYSGPSQDGKGAVGTWQALGKSYYLATITFGRFDAELKPDRIKLLPSYGQLGKAVKDPKKAGEARVSLYKKGMEGAAKLIASGGDSLETKMDFAGKVAIIQYRAVYPSSEKCLKCHANVSIGRPIGVLALVRIKK